MWSITYKNQSSFAAAQKAIDAHAAKHPPRAKVYVASKFENHDVVRDAQGVLLENRFTITYDWTKHVTEGEPDKAACALASAKGVLDADALLMIYAQNMRGAYVELGLALGKKIPVYLVKQPEVVDQVFSHHPLVKHFSTTAEAIRQMRDDFPSK
jgi:nucleoside 2-deoxyribosyltransferase